MANIIIQVSKYLIIILMAAYTFSCFSIFTRSYEDEENKVLIRQDVLLFMIQITAFIAMYFATQDLRMMFIYGDGSHLIIQSDLPECFETGCQ